MNYKENAETVRKYLDDNDWHYAVTEDEDSVSFTGSVSSRKCVFSSFHFRLLVEDECVQNFVTLPVAAGEKLAEVAEFITRMNYSLKYGRMDMDYLDGEIRYHYCVPMAAVRQDPDGTLEIVLNLAGNVLTRFGGGIAKILFGDIDPKTAYEQCIEGEF